jgi:murein DD-endopeptidase MepM/ murein hydrolase activator NlpD
MVAVALLWIAMAAPAQAAGKLICSDYRSRINCIGKKRDLHHGIDFGAPAGTEVIAAMHGTFQRRTFDECAGHGMRVETAWTARSGDLEARVLVVYAHVEALAHWKTGQEVKPGDVLGRIIPLRKTRCYGSREHVHYELRVGGFSDRAIDPHAYWAGGLRKPGCFKDGMVVPAGKAVAPLRC